MPLAAVVNVVAGDVSTRMVSVVSMFTTGLGACILRGLQINGKKLAQIRMLADKTILLEQF